MNTLVTNLPAVKHHWETERPEILKLPASAYPFEALTLSSNYGYAFFPSLTWLLAIVCCTVVSCLLANITACFQLADN
jgi:hypothetical protein